MKLSFKYHKKEQINQSRNNEVWESMPPKK